MRNTYFLVRHGKSLANEQGVILSDPALATVGFGLTKEGVAQVQTSIEEARKKYPLGAMTVIVSSDFLRSRETAEIIAEVIGVKKVIFAPELRERYFGIWEKTSTSNYQKVWSKDEHDAEQTEGGVESVQHVLARAKSLVMELEDAYTGRNVILVSHGDVLQILQTAFGDEHSSQHRSLAHFNTAEIRKVDGELKEAVS